MDKEAKITVGKVTSQIIDRIENLSDSQKGAELATFRNSIGKSITEADDVWPILFRYLPKDFLSETGRETFEENGYKNLPICIAKTQNSISHDPKMICAPKDYIFPIKDVQLYAGAGFVVALAGDIMTMPGLPKSPAALEIDVDDDGVISGLF